MTHSIIRPAQKKEHTLLTGISFAAKKYWNYPDHYLEIWRKELTITPDSINNNEVFVYETNNEVTGFYSLVTLGSPQKTSGIVFEAGIWLEHMFLLPEYIGQGIGKELFHHCITLCAKKDQKCLHILADPNAAGFYSKMGCIYLKDFPSTIQGRTTPYFQYSFQQ